MKHRECVGTGFSEDNMKVGAFLMEEKVKAVEKQTHDYVEGVDRN